MVINLIMIMLTVNEQKAVSGGGEYFDQFSLYGAAIGGIVLSPLALIMATFATDNPNAQASTATLVLATVMGIGASVGAVIGGSIGLTIDYFYSEE